MEWEEALGRFTQLQAGPEPAYQASKRLMDAEQALANGPDEKIAPAQGHLRRVRELARGAAIPLRFEPLPPRPRSGSHRQPRRKPARAIVKDRARKAGARTSVVRIRSRR